MPFGAAEFLRRDANGHQRARRPTTPCLDNNSGGERVSSRALPPNSPSSEPDASPAYESMDMAIQTQLTMRTQTACRMAPGCFTGLMPETEALHAALEATENDLGTGAGLSATQRRRFDQLLSGCCNVLEDLETLIQKYDGLSEQNKRSWDRIGDAKTGVSELRSRITFQNLLLESIVKNCQVAVENKLEALSAAVEDGKYTSSQLYLDSLANERQAWRALREPLTSVGITVAAFQENSAFIIDHIKTTFAPRDIEQSMHTNFTAESEAGPQNVTTAGARVPVHSRRVPRKLSWKNTKKATSIVK